MLRLALWVAAVWVTAVWVTAMWATAVTRIPMWSTAMRDYFSPHDQELFDRNGRHFDWG